MFLNCDCHRSFSKPRISRRARACVWILGCQMLARRAVNRNLVGFLQTIILEQRVNANCEVEFNEEEENAEFRDLKAEEHSDDAKDERDDQKKNVKH